jgi:uncharacterized protein with ATP-grasp and redox domains
MLYVVLMPCYSSCCLSAIYKVEAAKEKRLRAKQELQELVEANDPYELMRRRRERELQLKEIL